MSNERPERIPAGRWLAGPWQTFRLWHRMKVYGPRDYRQALQEEIDRCLTIAMLEEHYRGEPYEWQLYVPRDLRWKLRKGVFVKDAVAQAEAITGHKRTGLPHEGPSTHT